ncbi:hypothetical protein TanjilG_19784 [Lupinus angustifolius]|uniref:Uncharacterized protein n=2 Tax=Lupinus angustifolius TaxID=3871 RepID=A0A1J7GMM9_LUPAN|nr:hypothetical protein TanjilG_19784 [Lupinus angustifolius]
MNEFKSSPQFASAPLNLNGESQNIGQDNSVKWVSEDSRRSSRQVNSRGLPELPKGPKRSSNNTTDSPIRERSNKPRQSRKTSKLKDSSDESNSTEQIIQMETVQGDGSPARNLSDIPKKSHRKKSKDSSCGSESSKLRSKGQSMEPESPSGFVSKSKNNQRPLEENEHYQRGVSEIS